MKLFAIVSVFALSSILVSGSAIGSTINIDKRQNICTDGACTVECAATPAAPTAASVAQCEGLIDYIASYAPGKLTLSAGQNQTWTNGTCGIAVLNNDTVPYTLCYETIAFDAGLAVDTCFGTTAAGACVGSGASGDNYLVGVLAV